MQKGNLYSLESLSADPLATRNTILFACLTAMGIPPEPLLCGEYVENINGKTVSVTVWRLRDRSIDGRYDTGELMRLFHDPDFVAREPEHPLAYLKTGFSNYSRALEFIQDQGPIAVRRRGKKIGLISRRTTPDQKKMILDELNK